MFETTNQYIYIYPSKYHDKYHTPTCYFIVIGTNLDLANELGLHPTKMASSASGIAAGAVASSGRMEPRLGKPPEKSRFFATEMRNSYGDDRMALHYKPSSYLGYLHCRLNSHIYIPRVISLCFLVVGVFARPLHSTSQFDKTSEQVCVCVEGVCV